MDENALKTRDELYGSVMEYMREFFPGMIDRAYEFFWEEEEPENFLSGLALELGFINFEDWFVCDYAEPETGLIIDLFLEKNPEEDRNKYGPLKKSVISAFRVKGVNEDTAELEDLLLLRSYVLKPIPIEGLKEGDFFAARLLEFPEGPVLGACIYPFGSGMGDMVLDAVNSQFIRYKKNKNPQGTTRDFLKEEGYTFNMIWMSGLYKKK